jgi:hypothetical protein
VEQLLHNQSALRLNTRLLFQAGVMVTNVPWWLRSAELRTARRTAEHAENGIPAGIR